MNKHRDEYIIIPPFRFGSVANKPTDFTKKLEFDMRYRILQQLKGKEFDIIHILSLGTAAYVGKILKEEYKIPLVYTNFLDYTIYEKTSPIYRSWYGTTDTNQFIKDKILPIVDQIIISSYKMIRYFKRLDTSLVRKLVYTPVSINLELFRTEVPIDTQDDLYRKYNLAKEDDIVLYVGSLQKAKNLEPMIDVFKEILEKNPNTKFIIAGDGSGKASLMRKTAELELEENVIFTGNLNYPNEVYKIYHIADVFLAVSKGGALNSTVAEAMATGLPIVAVEDELYKNYVIDGENGYLGKIEELADKVVTILKSEETKEKFGKKSIEISDNFSVENYINKTLVAYDNAINKKEAEAIE
jgi:1,2-diacylglycerol 3-alpha-glucosyltransferase